MKRALPLLLLLGCSTPGRPIDADNFAVTAPMRLAPGRYEIADVDGNGAVRINADNVTIDFAGVELVGGEGDPDTFKGMGIVVEGRVNVTVKNARVRGYKVGIYARDCHGLVIEGCDVSGNFAQRLHSTPDHCDEGDWLWPHENDDNEWFKNYGASIGLDRCTNALVHDNRGRRSQNGIVLSRTRDSAVYDNDFSFHSGWGLAMYRSSRNEVSRNKFDYGVRGFSHGKFARGQDSAGILVFEQCSDNVFAYNSATHGGDGFFLYAGNETTQETGEGGCNRNYVFGNDFSHAVANAIEATFSDGNSFECNILDESNYGVWAGYSYNTRIIDNRMRGDLDSGIAIEHGHDNHIEGNTIENCGTAIHLWGGDPGDFAKTPYAKKHNIKSENYKIFRNTFTGNGADLRTEVTDNIATEGSPTLIISGPVVRGTQKAFLPEYTHRGLKTILVGEWGPYDYSRVEIVPSTLDAWGEAKLFIYEPWDAKTDVRVEGDVDSKVLDGFPRAILVTPRSTMSTFTVRAGDAAASGTLYRAEWTVKFYAWDKDPLKHDAEPLVEFKTPKLDFNWGGGAPHEKVPADHFATVATAEIELKAGTYEFTTTSDDGVRLTVDDKVVIDNWTWHAPTENSGAVKLADGKHAVKLEHFEIDGWAVLGLKLRRR